MLRRIIYNKNNHIDVRNILGVWSLVKWLGDSTFIILGAIMGGGAIFHKLQIPKELSTVAILAMALYGWSVLKEILDTPLVIIWTIGKAKHIARTQRRHFITWLVKRLTIKKRGRPCKQQTFIFAMARKHKIR